jgi:PilZ domain.
MDERRAPRFHATFPVEIEPAGGVTIDMSSSGIAFESSHPYEPGDEIVLRILLGRAGSPTALELRCRGRVVRVEPGDEKSRIAATVEWIDDEDGPVMMPTMGG